MTIYLDLIFFMNLIYDFLILLTVGLTLKRNIKFIRYILGSLVGALSIFLLFININNNILFILKVLTSLVIVILTFKFISIRYTLNNLCYFYMISIILAGFLYFLNVNINSYKGLVIITDKVSINYLLLIVFSPIVLFFYYKSYKKQTIYKQYYKIDIVFDNLRFNLLGYLDSGNNLKDPITNKSIIIVHKKILDKIYNIRSPMYVPFNTISGTSLMQCYKPSYIIFNNKKIYNYLIGVTNHKFSDGINALLNVKLMEDGYV